MAASNLNSIRRQVKNVAYNYSETQVKVREATSNDPWGPSSSLMSEIADLTNNHVAFTEIMQMLWKRLNDKNKNWRHVYKSLVLMDYLIKCGSERVGQQCKENIFSVDTLKSFQHIEDNKDQGHNIRQKATQIVALLKDDDKLKNERARAIMARKRFVQNSMGIASDGSHHRVQQRGGVPDQFDEARPTSVGEEEMQLQIALALSREEADKDEERRKGDDVRLQMALNESRDSDIVPAATTNASNQPGPSQPASSNIDDLLSLGMGGSQDPWGGQSSQQAAGGQMSMNDPWAAEGIQNLVHPPAPANGTAGMGIPPPNGQASMDPWGAPVAQPPQQHYPSLSATNDPWAPTDTSATNGNGMPSAGFSDDLTGTSLNLNGGAPTAAMMASDDLMSSMTRADNLKGMRTSSKTPETFLGENSALVNLDELLGPSAPVSKPAARSTSANPFLSAATAVPAGQPNPFAAQQRPSPTLNEMRTQNMALGAEASNMAPSTGDWSSPLPPAMQPMRTAAAPTNPFL